MTVVILALVALAACGPKKPEEQQRKELSPTEKVRMADSFRNAGRMNEALEILEEAVAESPDSSRMHGIYGEYLFLAGRYVAAEEELNRALVLDPHLTDSRNWLGATLAEQERYAEAQEQYEWALKDPAYPTPELIHLNLGMLYRARGMDQEGVDAFRQAVQINPRFFKAHLELALALESVGKLEEALDEIVVAEPAFRADGEYWYRRGFLEFRVRDPQRALESLRRCLDVSPGSPAAAQARELMEMIKG
jgi:type IV pilus assembly protein PilF